MDPQVLARLKAAMSANMEKSTMCGFCKKKVYFKERKKFLKSFWHRKCFKCQKCKCSLMGGLYTEHQKLPYCQSCYNKNFKVKGYGYGMSNLDSFKQNKDKPSKTHIQSANKTSPNE